MHLLHLKNYPILKQLQLEEALLRLDERNFCIINEGSPAAIVMGISGKIEELIDQSKLSALPVPVIKRFSGGGTVVVNEDTLFVSFICQKELHDFPAYPEPIMRWTEGIYQESLGIEGFHLRENDYAIGEHKCGGNAQYICKNRWLHHSTFLWDYDQQHMDLLLHPKKTPKYREGRSHDSFLTKLSTHFESKQQFVERLKKTLALRCGSREISLEKIVSILTLPHRQSTTLMSIQQGEPRPSRF